MNSILRCFIVIAVYFASVSLCGQILETKRYVGVSVGYGLFTGSNDELFFPKSNHQNSKNIHMQLGHKIINGLEGGILLNYLQLSDFKHLDRELQSVSAENGIGFSVGPFVKLRTPFQSSGFYNQAGFGVLVAPGYFELSENRIYYVDNVIQWNDESRHQVVIQSAGKYSGIVLQIEPEFSYQLTQTTGIRISWFNHLMSLDTGYDKVLAINMGVSIGFRLHFGHYKLLY